MVTFHDLRLFGLNHNYNQTIGNIPMNVATGSTCDVSSLICFDFWKHVHFNSDYSSFPSKLTEETDRFVGIS